MAKLFSFRFVLFVIFCLFTLAFINTAWVAEDAFITFRSVDNMLAGYGPVWNIGERVQVYTHPLWYILLVIGNFIVYSPYYVALVLNYLCLLGFLYTYARLVDKNKPDTPIQALLVIIILLFSRAFVDYSSSGLENSLLHILIAGYVYFLVSQDVSLRHKLLWCSLIFSGLFLTRPDGILLVLPASLYLFIRAIREEPKALLYILLGLLPMIFWEIFSIIYYGSFVPNTALAKVNNGVPLSKNLSKAYEYFKFNLLNDAVTLSIVFLAVLCGLFKRNITLLLVTGIILQIVYLCYVGADYMLGRFLSSSMVMAIIIMAIIIPSNDKRKTAFMMMLFAPVALTSVFIRSPLALTLFSPITYTAPVIDVHGNADERGFYYQYLGLKPVIGPLEGWYQSYRWFYTGSLVYRNPGIYISCFIGMQPWKGGYQSYWIDPMALSEPFLARLPSHSMDARTGHYERAFPPGYLKSKISGTNQLENPELHHLYDDVELAVKGDIWARERWGAIWRLNTGYYKHMDRFFDRNALGPRELVGNIDIEWDMHKCMGALEQPNYMIKSYQGN